jgi:HEPN domain-containing protein
MADYVNNAGEWMRFAQRDYDIAVHDMSFMPMPVEIICYHCQPAAEKAVKAVLVDNEIGFPFTHSVEDLLKLCPDVPAVSGIVHTDKNNYYAAATRLTKYATISRYPNEKEITESDMRGALADAKMIVESMKGLLNKRGINKAREDNKLSLDKDESPRVENVGERPSVLAQIRAAQKEQRERALPPKKTKIE